MQISTFYLSEHLTKDKVLFFQKIPHPNIPCKYYNVQIVIKKITCKFYKISQILKKYSPSNLTKYLPANFTNISLPANIEKAIHLQIPAGAFCLPIPSTPANNSSIYKVFQI